MTYSDPPLLNVSAMARQLGVKSAWLASEAKAGRVPAVPAGDTFLFDPPTVERTLRERAKTAPAAGDAA